MPLCMMCKQIQTVVYFVSEEDAKDTSIEGPLVCRACYTKTFPGTKLPIAECMDQAGSHEVRLGSPLLVSAQSSLGRAFTSSPRQAARKFSLEEALQFIANENPTSCVGFTWGPGRFNKAWADAIRENNVIEYSLSIPKDCEQGLGVYLAVSIAASCSYGNTQDTTLMMVTCTKTPTLDYSSKKLKEALAARVLELSGVTMDWVEIMNYLGSKSCRVRAVKKYGNYFAITTGENVTTTFNGADMKNHVKQHHKDTVRKSSYPHAKAYIKELFG